MSKAQFGALIFILIIAGLVGFVGYRFGTRGKQGTTTQEVLPGRPYQAIFLTNGQVYFGKVTRKSPGETTLRDIYYLQVQQPIQPPPEGQPPQPQIQLVKLGSELHKPRDEMTINNDHILFVEDIEEEGQVIQAIRRFQRGEVGPAASSGQDQPAGTEQTQGEKKSEEKKPEPSKPEEKKTE